jgi:dipeptidyl aminopeptidase/acylaminoacyl peptidase
MKNFLVLLFSILSLVSNSQDLNSGQLLNKSITYHDPNGNWPTFNGILTFDQLSPTSSTQKSRIVHIDRPNDQFEFIEIGQDTIQRILDGNLCTHAINGDFNLTKEELFIRGLTCERTKMYKNYYTYLYGLPMKLKDPGTNIDQKVNTTVFNGIECLTFRVTYDTAVGKDSWDFFFDPTTYALKGYRFYHGETKNDGEYITLYGEEIINGIRMPKNRFWYYNADDLFLGADLLQPDKIKSKIKKDISDVNVWRYSNLINKKIFNLQVDPNWMEDSKGLWYIDQSPNGKVYKKLIFSDPQIMNLFDHEKMASSLSRHFDEEFESNNLDLPMLEYVGRDSLRFTKNQKSWLVDVNSYQIDSIVNEETSDIEGSISPDEKWTIYTKDYNLFLKSQTNSKEIALSSDGEKNYAYGSYYGWFDKMEGENTDRPERFDVSWSPDSKYVFTRICNTRNADKMYMLDFSQEEAFRPSLWSYYRGSPGDTNMVLYQSIIIDVENQKVLPLHLPVTTHINPIGHHWSDQENLIYLRHPSRGYLKDELSIVDLRTLESKTIIEESSNTGIDYFDIWYAEESGKIIYTSEKTGWKQLYAFDIKTSSTSALTTGDYFVDNLVHIDKESGEVLFVASGKENGYNPYWQQLYKVNINGGEIARLTPEKAHHSISMSADGKYFVDNYSTLTSPTRTILRKVDEEKPLVKLSKADVSQLYADGWVPPHSFEAVARDGKTKIYGALWKPSHFDPNKKYPIIDHSYTGPHTQVYPRHFNSTLNRDNQGLAELGFIVIMVDGMGTMGRSKEFQDVSYKNMGKNLEDHVLAIRQLHNQYKWIDTEKVGIFGHSAGGYDAAHALLEYPDFYKVGVASSADHDFRMEKAWWPEMYMGWPVDSTYHEVSNITMADRLEGKLLLVHGAMDDNVNASATFKLVEALVEADKEFDLLILPSQRHGYQGKHADYFRKKRWKYFVENLLHDNQY